ncbi:hypothetical protein BDW69DRAFT_85777 [Aspergillus filifer]
MAKLPESGPVIKEPTLRPRVIDPNLQPGFGPGLPRRSPAAAAPAAPKSFPKTVNEIRQTKEYKAASRRWLSTIVALPILIYSSWELYDRRYRRTQRKHLDELTPIE